MTHPLAALIAGVKVKPLEWEAGERDQRRADSILGEFCVTFFGGRWFYQGEPRKGMLDAQAAAQADYETRILAALEAAPVPDLVEAGKVLEGVTPGPWMYRPNKYDDWGVVKADDFHLCQVRDPNCYMTEDLDAARAAKIDPWEANARFVAWCREGVPALIALATAQAAQIAGLKNMCDVLTKHWEKTIARADAAEAKVAELEASALRADQAAKADYAARAKAEAVAATLRAEVERLREAINYLLTDVDDDLASAQIARAALEGKND